MSQPEIQLWLQVCADLSRTKKPGKEGCNLGSQQHPGAWDAASLWTISFAGAAGEAHLARCVSQVFILGSHTPSGFHTGFGYPIPGAS